MTHATLTHVVHTHVIHTPLWIIDAELTERLDFVGKFGLRSLISSK